MVRGNKSLKGCHFAPFSVFLFLLSGVKMKCNTHKHKKPVGVLAGAAPVLQHPFSATGKWGTKPPWGRPAASSEPRRTCTGSPKKAYLVWESAFLFPYQNRLSLLKKNRVKCASRQLSGLASGVHKFGFFLMT